MPYTSGSAYIILKIRFYSDAYSFIRLYTDQFLSQKPRVDIVYLLTFYTHLLFTYLVSMYWLYCIL